MKKGHPPALITRLFPRFCAKTRPFPDLGPDLSALFVRFCAIFEGGGGGTLPRLLLPRPKQLRHPQQIIKSRPLGRVHVLILRRVHRGRLLARREIPQITPRLRHLPALVRWKRPKLGERVPHLCPLTHGKVLHPLIVGQDPLPLLGRHGIQPRQLVPHPLLRLLRQLVEPRLAPERLLLLLRREVAVLVHPVRQVLSARRARRLRVPPLDLGQLRALPLVRADRVWPPLLRRFPPLHRSRTLLLRIPLRLHPLLALRPILLLSSVGPIPPRSSAVRRFSWPISGSRLPIRRSLLPIRWSRLMV